MVVGDDDVGSVGSVEVEYDSTLVVDADTVFTIEGAFELFPIITWVRQVAQVLGVVENR